MAKKVHVGMSGGVDSSVTAYLLKQAGYDVTGVYMKNWTQDLPGFACGWQEDYQDAKRVATQLAIPFKLYDFEKQYRRYVVEYMLDEYQAGRTPNPDIMCNQEIKFKLFLKAAIDDGADMIATGHYARVKDDQLYVGVDEQKDQSYFLYRITKQALKLSLMPIGDLHKNQVRALAKKIGLVTADKKDSQGICFIGEVSIKDFLISELGPQSVGSIIDVSGKVLGKHDGALFYTIGQRHGLNVGGGLPYYVVGKNMAKNEVYVTTDLQDKVLWRNSLVIDDTHWINSEPNSDGIYYVKSRYRAKLIKVKLLTKIDNNRWQVDLKDDERAITPGQSVVLYEAERCVGGGIIT